MMKVEDFGFIFGMRGCLPFVIDVEYLGMMRSIAKQVRRQYGEWLKAGGVLKVGGEKEKLKEQSVTKKGCSTSMVVDDGTGEERVAGNWSSLELVVGGRAEEENGMVIMEEAAPLDMEKSPVTSNHGEQGE